MRTIAIDIRLIGKQRTGDETVFFHLTKNILALDQENKYALFTDETDANKLALLRAKLGCVGNTRVTFVSLRAHNRFIWNLWAVPWCLFRHPVDVYHTQYIAPLWMPKKVQLFTHIHDVSFRAHPEWIGRVDRFFLSLLMPRSLARSRFILVPSVFTQSEVIRFFSIDAARVKVIPNALDKAWLNPVSETVREQVQKKFQLTKPYCVTVGTMQPRKNISFLLTAFEDFKKTNPNAILVLVGNPDGHHVEKAVREAYHSSVPGLIFTGYVSNEELRALVAASQGMIFPSRYEGFGIPILEAFATGVPVAAADIPPFREVGGNAAFFFDLESLVDLKKALYTLFTDDHQRTELTQLGYQRLFLFTWEESARQLIRLYNQV